MPKRITLPCDNTVNEKTINDGDPIAIKEFRKRIVEKGLNINERLILNFHHKSGAVVVQEYTLDTVWLKGMQTFSIGNSLSPEQQKARNLRKVHKDARERVSKRPTRRFYDMLLH